MNEHAGRQPAKRIPPPPVGQTTARPAVAKPDQPLIVVAQWTGALATALWWRRGRRSMTMTASRRWARACRRSTTGSTIWRWSQRQEGEGAAED
jgi:hypothetical protein